jgi:pimeloyl-ACP methyl ester carboxylesterase
MSPRSSQMWTWLQPQLARPTIAPDRPGYGFSDAPPHTPTLAEYAAAMWELLDALGIAEPVDLLGMHTGALEALEMTLQRPQSVGRLGMIAVPVFNAEERAQGLETFAKMRVTPTEDGAHLLPAWRARFQFRQPPFELADVQRRFVDYLLAPWPGQAYEAVFRYDAEAALRRLRHPIVAFAPDDDVIAQTRRARALLPPGSEYLDLPDWDVDLCRTHAADLAALIDRHLPWS